jgi:hypothetical protein
LSALDPAIDYVAAAVKGILDDNLLEAAILSTANQAFPAKVVRGITIILHAQVAVEMNLSMNDLFAAVAAYDNL